MESENVQFKSKNSCIHEGRVYPETTQVCGHQICIVCKSGLWEELPLD